MGGNRGRVGCSLNGAHSRSASPGEITLFWSRRDDIMTDGNEDVGTGAGKRYLLALTYNGTEETGTHTLTHTLSGAHFHCLILYSNGLKHRSSPTEHNDLLPYMCTHTHYNTLPLTDTPL